MASAKRSTLSTGLASYLPAKGGAAQIPTGEPSSSAPALPAPAPAPVVAPEGSRPVGRPSMRQPGDFKTFSLRISKAAWLHLHDLEHRERYARPIHAMLLEAVDDFLERHKLPRSAGDYEQAKAGRVKRSAKE